MTEGIADSPAKAQETLEASKETAIKKRAFNGKSSTFTNSSSFLRKFVLCDRLKLQENMTFLVADVKKYPARPLPDSVNALLMHR
ncbi:TPA: hypothetical protein R4057_003991 [Kluyvera ascorbata]|uniref:hypothetical protein n=1 Tax=Kluyvera ascorbata TaxID=51288 RepID=UPI0022E6573F|nr:hypothetical protein [Kluyvera ascorbata]MEB6390374.1 hypothetical protein [Kluyvera ascorbata]HDG1678655.1 hypothetical protein [Kluyvera ascorbata]HED3066970.1 hypothetical protein [Kluyvera ascorbata]